MNIYIYISIYRENILYVDMWIYVNCKLFQTWPMTQPSGQTRCPYRSHVHMCMCLHRFQYTHNLQKDRRNTVLPFWRDFFVLSSSVLQCILFLVWIYRMSQRPAGLNCGSVRALRDGWYMPGIFHAAISPVIAVISFISLLFPMKTRMECIIPHRKKQV